MKHKQPITTKPGHRGGELVVQLPPAWNFRLRRVLRSLLEQTLPDPRATGLSIRQRDARLRARSLCTQLPIPPSVSQAPTAPVLGTPNAPSSPIYFDSWPGPVGNRGSV